MTLSDTCLGSYRLRRTTTTSSVADLLYDSRPSFGRDFATHRRRGIFKDLQATSMLRSYKGMTPAFPPSCYVDESAQLIGDVVLGENASVWMNAVLRGDVHYIRVGAN